MLTFAQVEAAFKRCYNCLREVNNENAPSSYTWYAQTVKALEESAEVEFTGEGERAEEGVAYVYECNGNTLTVIHSDWSVEKVEDFFWECFGFDELFPREESSTIAE